MVMTAGSDLPCSSARRWNSYMRRRECKRHAEPVLAFEHQPVEAGRVDAALRVACRNLPGGDVGRTVDGELQRDRQFGEIDIVAFNDDVVPRRLRHRLARDVLLAALAERGRQFARLDAEAGRQQAAVRRHVGHDGQCRSRRPFRARQRDFCRRARVRTRLRSCRSADRPVAVILSSSSGYSVSTRCRKPRRLWRSRLSAVPRIIVISMRLLASR